MTSNSYYALCFQMHAFLMTSRNPQKVKVMSHDVVVLSLVLLMQYYTTLRRQRL